MQSTKVTRGVLLLHSEPADFYLLTLPINFANQLLANFLLAQNFMAYGLGEKQGNLN